MTDAMKTPITVSPLKSINRNQQKYERQRCPIHPDL